MNLGTQLKWFHDFWTSTQGAIIRQSFSLGTKLETKIEFLEKESLLPRLGPHEAA